MERIKIVVFAMVLVASLLATAGTAWAWSVESVDGVSWETTPTGAD